MATVTKKDKFFEVLRNIFVGAKIEGNSGYVNLMKIKSKYYNEFKEQLQKDIDEKLKEVGQNFEEELYNKLFTFFKKYFSESGSIYFSYTPLQEKVYERIYRDDKDVMLFWKTHMLYYVKTERLFKNMEVEDEDIVYLFDVAELQHKKNNEKKELVYEFVKAEHTDKRRVHFTVKYSANGSKNKTEEILKKIKKEKAFGSISLKQVEKVLGIFKRQSEVDYFINKDAKGFLKEQFSLWIKGYLIDDETLFEPARLNQLKALQKIAYNIIDLVGQFEDELVKVWNKPKFAHSSSYVITLDKIAAKDFTLLEKIVTQNVLAGQIKEWQELGIIAADFQAKDIINNKKLNTQLQFLPLDTKFIKEFELDILALFTDLDNQLDGWLIHSENYQALNNLRIKFNDQIQSTYIDPPFNTGEDFIYLDNYQDSSWLTIMENRISIAAKLLNKKGTFFLHLDHNANHLGRFILNKYFGKDNYQNEIIWHKGREGGGSTNLPTEYNSIQVYKKDDNRIWNAPRKPYKLSTVQNIEKDEKGWFYSRGRMGRTPSEWEVEAGSGLKTYVYNDTSISKEKVIEILTTSSGESGAIVGDVWNNEVLGKQGKVNNFETEKPESLLKMIIEASSNAGQIVLDFFSGGGTTISTAHKLKRKWIGIEQGNHFWEFYHSVNKKTKQNEKKEGILGRLKLTLYGQKKGITNDVKWQGGGFFKYFILEQYEESLSKIKYEDKNSLPKQDIYHQYLFLKDLKLADEVVKIEEKTKSIKVDLTKLHPAIDIPETLSHITGKFIKQIKKDEVIFTDGTSIDLTNIDYKIVKPLIWW